MAITRYIANAECKVLAFGVPSRLVGRSPSPLVGEGWGGGDGRTVVVGIPPTPSPSPQGGGESPHARLSGMHQC